MNFACQEVMDLALGKKTTVFLWALAAFALGAQTSWAEAPKLGRPVPRSLVVWEQPVEYQFILKNNPRLPYDGEASRKLVKGQEIPLVVLNKAFFRKEAKDLFQRFEKNSPAMEPNPVSKDRLHLMENHLLTLKSPTGELPKLDQETLLSLKQFKEYLEYLAWSPLYRSSLQETQSRKKALRRFEKAFIQTRLETIEWHEAAHLSDLKGNGVARDKAFGQFTELNAFFAELVYGTNPHDVIAQALTGLIDEVHQGKNVDFSFQKFVTVVKFLKENPRSAKRNRFDPSSEKDPWPRNGLESFARLKTSDYVTVGRELYRQNLRASGQNLAALY